MKKCNVCGTNVKDEDAFCSQCGGSQFTSAAENDQNTCDTKTAESANNAGSATVGAVLNGQPAAVNNGAAASAAKTADAVPSSGTGSNTGAGNIIAGIVGAFLFSLIGGALYFVVYQMGFVAGICGLIIFILANFGYGLFSGNKNNASAFRIIISVVITVAVIFISEYLCVSYALYDEVTSPIGFSFFDTVRITPDYLEYYDELMEAVIHDLAFAYLFGLIAVGANIYNLIKAKKGGTKSTSR